MLQGQRRSFLFKRLLTESVASYDVHDAAPLSINIIASCHKTSPQRNFPPPLCLLNKTLNITLSLQTQSQSLKDSMNLDIAFFRFACLSWLWEACSSPTLPSYYLFLEWLAQSPGLMWLSFSRSHCFSIEKYCTTFPLAVLWSRRLSPHVQHVRPRIWRDKGTHQPLLDNIEVKTGFFIDG